MGDRIKTALDEFKDRTVLIVKDHTAAIKSRVNSTPSSILLTRDLYIDVSLHRLVAFTWGIHPGFYERSGSRNSAQ
jgi:hypothetical protein